MTNIVGKLWQRNKKLNCFCPQDLALFLFAILSEKKYKKHLRVLCLPRSSGRWYRGVPLW